MIKKIILITGLMLSANLWADMDNICFVNANAGMNKFNSVTWNHIRDNCERNNILVVFKIKDVANLMQFIPRYCRYDRAINKYLEPILEKIRISKIEDNGNPKNKESALAMNKPGNVSLEKYSSAIGLWRIKKPQMKQKANKKTKEIKTFLR